MNTFELTNNVVVSTSDVAHSRTGYEGSSFAPKWNGDNHFMAWAPAPTDDETLELLKDAKHLYRGLTIVELGHYADAREAAYVSALYRSNPKMVLDHLVSDREKVWETFPDDLYDLPVYLTPETVRNLVRDVQEKRAAKKAKTLTIKMGNEEARKVFWTMFDRQKQDAMFEKYGKECVVRDMIKLTWNEFDLRYDMEV